MMTDPEHQDRFLKFLSRAIPADGVMTPGLMARTALRGPGRDVFGLFGRRAPAKAAEDLPESWNAKGRLP
jgi:hypothetical protein